MILQINRRTVGKEYYDMIECHSVHIRPEDGNNVLYYHDFKSIKTLKTHPTWGFVYTEKETVDDKSDLVNDIYNVSVWHPERREVLWREPKDEDDINTGDVVDMVQKKTSEFLQSARERYRDMTS